ncbi:MAG: sulfotransferase [Gammaproteobacteria bacterium]|nr:sulfotransferase [Gammaproteobacteria bacterium]
MKKTNFFILGAPKCGTTALSEYLREHPNVFISYPKEPSFFASDLPGLQYVKTEKDYLNLFNQQKKYHSIIGEASPSYLYSETAIKEIKQFNPEAYLIIMIRNPINMLQSYHKQLLYSLFEDQENLEDAWRLQDDRSRGKSIPSNCREPLLLQYKKMTSFTAQIKRVLDHFPEKQVKIILFDNFKKSPQSVYDDVLHFLDISCDSRTHFPVINAAKTPRSLWVNKFIHLIPYGLIGFIQKNSNSFIHKKFVKLHQYINNLNSKKSIKKGISADFRRELEDYFSDEINSLSSLLKIDLKKYWSY